MVLQMDTRYHGYTNFSPSSSISSTTVEMMGEMGNSLVRIYDKKSGNLRLSYFQKSVDLTNNNSSVASSILEQSVVVIDSSSSTLSSLLSSSSVSYLDCSYECVVLI